MSKEPEGWLRRLWESDTGEYITGPELEEKLQEFINAELAGQHFSVETLAALLELHEGVSLNPRTLRQFVNRLVETGAVVIARDGRGPGSDGRIYRSRSSLVPPSLNIYDISVELAWDQMVEVFNDGLSHSPRSIKAKKIG